MSLLSFLPSHRLHSSHRPWIEPLGLHLDLILHEKPREARTSEGAPGRLDASPGLLSAAPADAPSQASPPAV